MVVIEPAPPDPGWIQSGPASEPENLVLGNAPGCGAPAFWRAHQTRRSSVRSTQSGPGDGTRKKGLSRFIVMRTVHSRATAESPQRGWGLRLGCQAGHDCSGVECLMLSARMGVSSRTTECIKSRFFKNLWLLRVFSTVRWRWYDCIRRRLFRDRRLLCFALSCPHRTTPSTID